MGNILKHCLEGKEENNKDEYHKFKIVWSKINILKQKLTYFRNKAKLGVKLDPKVFVEKVLQDPDLQLWGEPITKYYKIGNLLGQDSYSIVKEATLISDPNFHVAVKAINYNKMHGFYHTIIQEILSLKQTDHPSIVKFLELYKDDEFVYLVLEKIEGVTLKKMMELEEKTTEKDTIIIIEQLLKIVKYLNNANIAHCDIRPNNILVNPITLSLKIYDFRSSNFLHGEVREPMYSSPEILSGKFEKKWDMWSIGVIAFEMLSGKLPFASKKK